MSIPSAAGLSWATGIFEDYRTSYKPGDASIIEQFAFAYDALSARLAAVEKERDEAVDLLGKILDACSGPEPTFGMYPQELWLELEGWLIAYDARLAKPEKETT